MNSTYLSSTTSISESFAYRSIVPWTIICLCSLYVNTLLFRFCMWRWKRYRTKRTRIERKRLQLFWKKRIIYINSKTQTIQTPDLALSNQKRHNEKIIEEDHSQSFDSSTTIFSLINSSSHDMQPYLVQPPQQENILSAENHLKHYNTRDLLDEKALESQRNRPVRWYAFISDKINSRKQKKRRQLLWQWSVAMGYCRYDHGYHMNRVIRKVLEKSNPSEE